jgi:hypothetical protein
MVRLRSPQESCPDARQRRSRVAGRVRLEAEEAEEAKEAEEVTQALLPVQKKRHSQEWLCYRARRKRRETRD